MSVQRSLNADTSKRASINTPPLKTRKYISNGATPTDPRRHSSESSTPCKLLSNNTNTFPSTPDYFKPIHLGTPMTVSKKSVNSENSNDENILNGSEENTTIVVAVRVRPLSQRENEDVNVKNVIAVNECTVTVAPLDIKTSKHHFTYDHCFWSADKLHVQYADQQHVYETIAQPLLDKAFEGYNTCLFAYGQTGSGKSYSIMGQQSWQAGIIPRFGQDLFERVKYIKDSVEKVCVEISYFEIYNEKIHDLLASSTEKIKKAPMRVREHPVLGPYVVDLSTFVVTCYDDLAGWLSLGNKRRATASTGMNDKSSRSHSVFTIVITQTEIELIDGEMHEHSRKSKVNIVDLAGSERINTSKTSGIRTKEGVSINKSLLTLGKVISQLAETSLNGTRKKVFIPYRESVLTWLLKESLGGNSKTTMLATISPANVHIEETLSTLRYANQARNIVNVVRVNEDPKAKLIRELREEIEKLRSQQSIVEVPVKSEAAQDEINTLREKLRETEGLLEQLTKSWQEKLRQATKCKAEEAQHLEKVGIATQINNHLPNLVNLNEDPQLSETLLYLLSEGDTRIGRMHGDSSQNIQLQGSLILDYHCTISNVNNVISIIPNKDGQTFVNGHLITEPTQLFHADRIVLGGEHFFRFNNPLEVQQDLQQIESSKDFLFAKKELLNVQEMQMKIALQNEREKTKLEMLEEIETIKRMSEMELGLQRQGFEDRIRQLNRTLEEQHLEIKQAENKRHKLELQNKLLQDEIENEKQLMNENESPDIDQLNMMQTNFLQEIMDYFDLTDNICLDKSTCAVSDIGLYELSIMIKEANQICEKLGKKITFMSQDKLTENGLEMMVKVQDIDRDLMIEWPISVFRSKLDLLQQMSDEEGFDLFDSDDSWKKDDHLPLTFSPKVLESLKKACSFGSPTNLSHSFNDIHDSYSKPAGISDIAKNTSIAHPRSILPRISIREKSAEINVLEMCKDHCNSMIKEFKRTCILEFGMDFTRLLINLSDLQQYSTELTEKSVDCGALLDGKSIYALKLTHHLSSLLLQVSKISTLYSYHIQRVNDTSQIYERVSRNLSEQYTKVFVKLATIITFVMQDIETNGGTFVHDSMVRLNELISHCGDLTGRVAASLGISLQSEDNLCSEISHEIGRNFIQGLDTIVHTALKTAFERLEHIISNLNVLANDSFFGSMSDNQGIITCYREVVNSMKEWVFNYKQLQMLTSESRLKCPQNIVSISEQCQDIILKFSNLIESTSNIYNNVENFVKGEALDSSENLHYISDIRELLQLLSCSLYLKPEDSSHQKAHGDHEHNKHLKFMQENANVVFHYIEDLMKYLNIVVREDS